MPVTTASTSGAGACESDLAKAQAFLNHRAAALRTYVASGQVAHFSVTPPIDVLAGPITLGVVAGMDGLTSVALAAVRRLVEKPVKTALGDTGEDLIQTLLEKELGWCALPFDQPYHGFDRMFTAPGLPLIMVECKVNRRGKLHLGQPQSGEQGSPEWIAEQAAQMADPASAQYSPDNAAIAALVEEMDAENVPSVAVVVTTETGAVDIHFRRPGSTEWEHLDEGMDLTSLLRSEVE